MFPELALTTFFPRWFVDDIGRGRPLLRDRDAGRRDQAAVRRGGPARRRLLPRLRRADAADDGRVHRYNAQVLVERDGSIVATYRKVHIPGHEHHEPDRPFQHARALLLRAGPDEFGVWPAFGARVGMMICNDRRWPESYRVMGLQGVELILCGYNTPIHYVPDPSQDILQGFHNALVMQSGRLPERHVGGRRRQGRRRGGRRLARPVHDRGPVGPDRRPGVHHRRRADRGACDLDWCASTRARCSTSTATAAPRSTRGSPPNVVSNCRRCPRRAER